MKTESYDFTISGAGLVGSILALALDKIGYRVCLIEKSNLKNNADEFGNFYPLSLNYRSKIILDDLGLWDMIHEISYPIDKLTILYRNNLSKIRFTSKEFDLDNLGYVVDSHKLLEIYKKSLDKQFTGVLKLNTEIRNVERHDDNLTLKLNSQDLNSKYLVVSDGIDSNLSKLVSHNTQKINYNQISFMMNCKGSFKQNHAIQFFNESGIFAFIPYTNSSASLILTLNKGQESKYFIDNEPIYNQIADTFSQYITDIESMKSVTSYDLSTHRMDTIYRDRIMLFGNSLQLIHPVGAQGYNFSLRCIEYMVDHLRDSDEIDLDINSFIQTVRRDRTKTISNVDIALKFLNNDHVLSSLISKLAFNLIKNNSSLKMTLLENVIGLNNYAFRK
tara:strand:- start:1934 stop:3103 length:1170 start_codon:yes stop_codon:yes gene_type:complete